jgi:hypothetical protein
VSKIILSYSGLHFNPVNKKWFDSAGFLSLNLFESLSEIFYRDEIIFTDHKDYKNFIGVKDVKLLIGVSLNLDDFAKIAKPDKTILWAVNKSAKDRLLIREEARNRNLPIKSLTHSDGIFSNLRETKYADYVLGIGGWSNYKSFVDNGMSPTSVYMIGASTMGNSNFYQYRGGENILFCAGSLSFRKGAHLILPILNLLKSLGNTKLIVVGKSNTKYWQEQMETLKILFPLNFEFTSEKLDFNSKVWRNIIASCQFAIFPSFEEGITGTAIDVVAAGLPLLISNEVGIEFTENTPILTMNSNDEWLIAIQEMLDRSFFEKKDLLSEQQKLARSGGMQMPQLKRMLSRIAKDNFWPSFDYNSSNDISLNKVKPIFPEFIVNDGSEDNNYSLDLQKLGSLPMSEDDYIRLGIMTLDKLIHIRKINVYNENNQAVGSVYKCEDFANIETENSGEDKAIKILYTKLDKTNNSSYTPIFILEIYNFIFMKIIYRFAIREKSIFRKILDTLSKKI